MSEAAKSPILVTPLDDGAFWRVALAMPKANVLDGAMTRALHDVFVKAADAPRLAGVLLTAEGPHFSFGASVAEHLPEHVTAMLSTFHRLFRAMAAARIPIVAAVRGQCLGGGLELAAFAHRVVVAPDARLGQPEIKLGVFAPVASALLPERVGPGVAADLCLSGRSIDGARALACGLADELADDPEAAALAWLREALLPQSATSLRFAVHALRAGFHARFFPALDRVERLYLDDLMRSSDAKEGIAAFLAKRAPHWTHS